MQVGMVMDWKGRERALRMSLRMGAKWGGGTRSGWMGSTREGKEMNDAIAKGTVGPGRLSALVSDG